MIRILHGVYGYRARNGSIVPKNPKSDPFSLSEAEEARLVGKGLARYVDFVPEVLGMESATAEQEPGGDVPVYNAQMSLSALRELAASHNIDTEGLKTKADIITALDGHFLAFEETAEGAPVFSPDDAI